MRFETLIEHNIEPQQLKADTIPLPFTLPVGLHHAALSGHEGPDQQHLDLPVQLAGIIPHLLNPPHHRRVAPLMPDIIPLLTRIKNKLLTTFVYGVVGEVHGVVVEVGGRWGLVGASGEAGQALLV